MATGSLLVSFHGARATRLGLKEPRMKLSGEFRDSVGELRFDDCRIMKKRQANGFALAQRVSAQPLAFEGEQRVLTSHLTHCKPFVQGIPSLQRGNYVVDPG